jgi:hypothetical protein
MTPIRSLKTLNRSIISNEMETVTKNLPRKKSTGPEGFTCEFYQTVKEEGTPILLKLFHKVQKEGLLPNSFYKANNIQVPKSGKD